MGSLRLISLILIGWNTPYWAKPWVWDLTLNGALVDTYDTKKECFAVAKALIDQAPPWSLLCQPRRTVREEG